MNNIHELEIDGLKPSEIPDVESRNWLPFLAFMGLMVFCVVGIVNLVVLAQNLGG